MEFWHYGWFTTVLVVPADIDLKLPFFFRKHFVRPKWECEDFWSNLTFCPICIQQRLLPPHVQFKTIRMRGRVFRSSHSEMSSHSLLVRRQVLALVPLCAHTLTHHTPTHTHTVEKIQMNTSTWNILLLTIFTCLFTKLPQYWNPDFFITTINMFITISIHIFTIRLCTCKIRIPYYPT